MWSQIWDAKGNLTDIVLLNLQIEDLLLNAAIYKDNLKDVISSILNAGIFKYKGPVFCDLESGVQNFISSSGLKYSQHPFFLMRGKVPFDCRGI